MKEKGGENGVTRGWLHSGGRSTSVAAAATSTLIGLTSYHLRERNVMNSRFVGSTAKISRECPPLPMILFFFFLFFLLAPFRTGNRRPLTYRSSVAFFFSRIIIYRSLIVPFFLSFFEKKAVVSLSPLPFKSIKKIDVKLVAGGEVSAPQVSL